MKPIPILFATVLASFISTLTAQQPGAGDPFVKGDNPPAATPQPAPAEAPPRVMQGLVRTEYFSLPHTLARKMMRQFPQQPALYEWLGKELENPQSEVKLEHLSLLKVRGGQRSKVEEINEYPYPTEFDPPQIPQTFGTREPRDGFGSAAPVPAPPPPPTPPPAPELPGANGDPGTTGAPAIPSAPDAAGSVPAARVAPPWPYTPTTPSSFTYKNTGWTLEVEMTIGEDGETVDLNLAPEHIKLISMVPQTANGEITQPLFETHKLTTQILTKLGRPTLIGTNSPPVATGAPGANDVNRTWLLFITVNPAR